MKKLFARLWPLGFIFVLWILFSWPFLAKGLIPFPSNYLVSFFPPWQYFYKAAPFSNAMPDVLSQLYPWRHLAMESFKNWQFPLWNPYLFSGTPLLANFQSAAFSPLNILFLILPFNIAWSFSVLFQPLLAMIFMFLFLRELKISQWGSLVGSIAFAFSGFLVTWMAYGTLSLTVAWLPLLLLSIEKSFKNPRIRFLSLLSITTAFAILSGHFQMSIYVVLTGLFYILFKFWQARNFKKALLIFIFLLLGIVIAAPQILPSLEFYYQSVRGLSFRQTEAIPWSYLVTLLAPDFYGNPTTQNNWFGHYAEWSGFIGILTIILGFWAFIRLRKKEVFFFLALGIIALLFALETPLADFLVEFKIPVISTSAASRVVVIFSFSLAVLAGFGVDSLFTEWDKKKHLKKLSLYLLMAGCVLVFLWALIFFFQIFPDDKLIIAKRNLILPSLIFILGAAVLLSGFFLPKKLRTILILIILIIVSFDSLRFAKKWVPFESNENLYPRLPVIDFLQKRVGADRVFGNFGNELSIYFHIPSIEGYDPLYPRRYKELISAAGSGETGDLFADRSIVKLEKNGEYSPRLLSLLGAKYILHATDDGWSPWVFPFWKNLNQYDLIYDGPKYQILENRNALPRAFLVSDYEIITDEQTTIKKLLNKDFDLRNKIILNENPLEKISSGSGKVNIINYSPNKVSIETNQETSQLLFLSDNYYPGWEAKVDNKKTKIYRANHTFRAIIVPGGQHLVEFTYKPLIFKIALILSGISILFLGLINFKIIFKGLK